jgi:hypothetical protein
MASGAGDLACYAVSPFFGWARDYPEAERQFLLALKCIQMRPVEQIVDLDSDEIFNYPCVNAVQVASWTFTEAQARPIIVAICHNMHLGDACELGRHAGVPRGLRGDGLSSSRAHRAERLQRSGLAVPWCDCLARVSQGPAAVHPQAPSGLAADVRQLRHGAC